MNRILCIFFLIPFLALSQVDEVYDSIQPTELDVLIIDKSFDKKIKESTIISTETVKNIPGANAGVENIIKTLPGVYSNNELSTQYAVRGGNYDENLVYVDEIEVYRPFLIRSGQQEGLSFVNSAMTKKINFSAGGFQAKYGDKMSSVLDITYRIPTHFQLQLDASLLGLSTTLDFVSEDKKWNGITSFRYRNNALFVKTQNIDVNYKPKYLDFQSLVNYNISNHWQLTFLSNISSNVYDYQPKYGITNFNTAAKPITIFINYQGQEKDSYQTYFGAAKLSFKPTYNNIYKFISSVYYTQEQENYDILSQYNLAEVDQDKNSPTYGEVLYHKGIGSQLSHGRNTYKAFITSIEAKGQHKINENEIEWGARYISEKIKDKLLEWEVIDSARYIMPINNVKANNDVTINRLNAFVQWNKRMDIGNHNLWINTGIRSHIWIVNNKKSMISVSPRMQIALKPDWDTDMFFRLSGGMYHQPPSYRELRNIYGNINNVDAQKSFHTSLSNEYSFRLGKYPFRLSSEIYYKYLTDVNTYTIENVRIRYTADNLSTAYAYGTDFRLNTELLEGYESWISVGYLKTEENYNHRGYIARPTDQRLNFALMFQDYMPKIPNLKMYLNLVYNTGLPGGSPSYADVYQYQNRLRDYRRADVGFSYIFKDSQIKSNKKWLEKFKELTVGFEIYNLFNNSNSITNNWIRDVYTKDMYAVPNTMTMRTFNIKINFIL